MRQRTMWLVLGLLLGTVASAIAEDVTLVTYYPSPRGVYKELVTTGTTSLATQDGSVGIGTTEPDATLEVNGTVRFSNLPVTGGGAVQDGMVLTYNADTDNVEWRVPAYQ